MWRKSSRSLIIIIYSVDLRTFRSSSGTSSSACVHLSEFHWLHCWTRIYVPPRIHPSICSQSRFLCTITLRSSTHRPKKCKSRWNLVFRVRLSRISFLFDWSFSFADWVKFEEKSPTSFIFFGGDCGIDAALLSIWRWPSTWRFCQFFFFHCRWNISR